MRSKRLFFASLHLNLRASACAASILALSISVFFLKIYSISTLLFLNEFPFTFKYNLRWKCLSIFFASLYFLNRRLSTRIRMIHRSFLLVLASRVPLRLPRPLWRPLERATLSLRTRNLEWVQTGLRMMRPSFTKRRIFWREVAFAISTVSFGSNQILRLPQRITAAARRFCIRKLLIFFRNAALTNELYWKSDKCGCCVRATAMG